MANKHAYENPYDYKKRFDYKKRPDYDNKSVYDNDESVTSENSSDRDHILQKNEQGRKRALIISVSDYERNLQGLDFCKNNGNTMFKLLKSLGYEIEDNHHLVGRVAINDIVNAIDDFFTDPTIKASDTLLFYYSGYVHIEEREGDGYISSSEIDPTSPYRHGYSYSDLMKMNDRSYSDRKLIILDCCYSGDSNYHYTDDVVKHGSNLIHKLNQGFGTYILASSQTSEEAFALRENGNSIFTYHLVEGLKGNPRSVDVDGNVTPHTLGKYIFNVLYNSDNGSQLKEKPIIKAEASDEISLANYTDLSQYMIVKKELEGEKKIVESAMQTIQHEKELLEEEYMRVEAEKDKLTKAMESERKTSEAEIINLRYEKQRLEEEFRRFEFEKEALRREMEAERKRIELDLETEKRRNEKDLETDKRRIELEINMLRRDKEKLEEKYLRIEDRARDEQKEEMIKIQKDIHAIVLKVQQKINQLEQDNEIKINQYPNQVLSDTMPVTVVGHENEKKKYQPYNSTPISIVGQENERIKFKSAELSRPIPTHSTRPSQPIPTHSTRPSQPIPTHSTRPLYQSVGEYSSNPKKLSIIGKESEEHKKSFERSSNNKKIGIISAGLIIPLAAFLLIGLQTGYISNPYFNTALDSLTPEPTATTTLPPDVKDDEEPTAMTTLPEQAATEDDIASSDSPPPFVIQWGSFGTGIGQFQGPGGVTTDSSESVYVADWGNNRIQKFTDSGEFITQWGSNGTGQGQFNGALGISSSSNSSGSSDVVFVTDENNNRIQKFTDSGEFITQWGSLGTGDGQFIRPQGVAMDSSGNVYIADLGNNRVQKFTDSGEFITQWGSLGTSDGEFEGLNYISIDSSGSIYVTDSSNRIQKFSYTS